MSASSVPKQAHQKNRNAKETPNLKIRRSEDPVAKRSSAANAATSSRDETVRCRKVSLRKHLNAQYLIASFLTRPFPLETPTKPEKVNIRAENPVKEQCIPV
jgi:hypothetical protein